MFLQAQSESNCPNSNFAQGDFTNWEGCYGCYPGGNPPPCLLPPCGIPGFWNGPFAAHPLHKIIPAPGWKDSNTCDSLTNMFPGENFVARLGDTVYTTEHTNPYKAGELKYKVYVTEESALFIYRYAVILQSGGHGPDQQPDFRVQITDPDGVVLDSTCGYYYIYAPTNGPPPKGWHICGGDVYWKEWTTVGMNLMDYIGDTVIIEFRVRGCYYGTHFGYAYISAYCNSMQVATALCQDDSVAVLTAPLGFKYYWFTINGDPTINGDTTNSITIPNPVTGNIYYCTLTALNGCQVTIADSLVYTIINTEFWKTDSCNTLIANFHDSSYVNQNEVTNWHWYFGDGAEDTVSKNPSHEYPAPGTYIVKLVSYSTEGCKDSITKTITINPVPVLTTSPLSKMICNGETTNIGLTGNFPGMTFSWSASGSSPGVWGFSPGNGDSIKQVLHNTGTVNEMVYYWITPWNGSCAGDSVQYIVTVTPSDSVKVSVAASANNICAGTAVTFTATPIFGGTTPSYQWQVNGTNTGLDNPVFSYTPASGDLVRCILTSSEPSCITNNPATSNVILMIVNPNLPVSVSIAPGANPVCAGTLVTFTATPVNGGATPAYQWKVNGVNAGINSPVYSYIPLNGDQVTCVVTSSETCTSGNPATSNVVTMIVNTNLPVSVSISPSANPICQGAPATFTATPVNGGSTPSYLWKVNGINVGPNGPVYTYNPVGGDLVTCVLTSSEVCATGNPATSNVVNMVTNPNLPVSVSIIASANPVCDGTPVTFTATPGFGGTTPAYQWKVNGINTGPNGPVFNFVPLNGDQVTCTLTSSEMCTTGNPAVSNTIAMTVNPNLPVSINIAPSANPVCDGTLVTFTATPVNGGTTPAFQWKVNGINAGINNPLFSYIPVNGDVVTCTLTSNEICTAGNPAVSNTITMAVNPNLPVSVSIISSGNPVCAGTSVTFTATPVNGGGAPSYQWKVNGVNAGTDNAVFTFIPLNNDVITCTLTSSEVCTSGNPAGSNSIIMTVIPNAPVSVTISPSADPVCAGTPVTFTAVPVNGGAVPSYQWQVNGSNVGINSPLYTYVPLNGDLVTCILTSSITCTSGSPATSNVVNISVNPLLPVSVSIAPSANPVCTGTSVIFTATPGNGGTTPFYQWRVNGINVGANNSTYNYIPANGDQVSCLLTSSEVCATGNPAASNTVVMTVNPLPLVTFTICFDSITSLDAKPITLKGGIPLGGSYSGAGVNTGIFYPALAGPGTHTITYSYTNMYTCPSAAARQVIVVPPSPFTCGSALTDIRDSKTYPTVQIGSQCWLATNLNYGSQIAGSQYQRDNCIPEKFCYNDLIAPCVTLGGLYQWDEMMRYESGAGSQGLCPPGWHVPTEGEWNILFNVYISVGFAGSPLKTSGYSGFNALLAGASFFSRSWNYGGFATFFWTSTSRGPYKAWAHAMNDPDPSVSTYPSYRANAFSVRCLKD